jgi:hypothetical protein
MRHQFRIGRGDDRHVGMLRPLGWLAILLGFGDCSERIRFEPRQTKPQHALKQLACLAEVG